MNPTVRRARIAFVWVGVVVPVVLFVVASAIVLAWYPQLPDPIAIHWGPGGADGFGPRWMVFFGVLIGLPLVLAFAALAWFAHRMPRALLAGGGGVVADDAGRPLWSVTARGLGAVNLGLGGMMSMVTVQMAAIQRGLSDAQDAPDLRAWGALAVLAGLSVLGWFLQPKVTTPPAAVTDAHIAPAASPDWSGTATMANGGIVTLGGCLLVLGGAAVFSFVAGGVGPGWLTLSLLIVMTVVILSMLVMRVRVSADGLVVRSILGWPRVRIEASDIKAVRVTEVNPFAEFGGWGYRWGLDGRRGVVLRRGPAIEVTRQNGKVFVVTVDGADGAAAALERSVALR